MENERTADVRSDGLLRLIGTAIALLFSVAVWWAMIWLACSSSPGQSPATRPGKATPAAPANTDAEEPIIVRIANLSSSGAYSGWHRCVVDRRPSTPSGKTMEGVRWIAGRDVGLLGCVVDLRFESLLPGARMQTDIVNGAKLKPDPVDVASVMRSTGTPIVSGAALPLAPTSVGGRQNPLPDGAGVTAHWRGRPSASAPMFCVDVWLTAYPDQPWAVGEVVVTASNPAVPDVVATVPAGGIALAWTPDGVAVVDGLPLGWPLLRAGETLGTGQARSFRFVVAWISKLTPDAAVWALAESSVSVVANGIAKPGLLGAVSPAPATFDAAAFVRANLPTQRARLHTWDWGPLGVHANSGVTGRQEDQGYAKMASAYSPGGIGTEWARYYAAMGQARRPAHHLEADGSLLSLTAHPQLVLWASRPHWSTGVSPDQLGKAREVNVFTETHGWNGPDREHWIVNSLFAALQWHGSPALQWQAECAARCFLYGETVDPRLPTSGPDAPRSAMYAGMLASWLWLALEDRTLAGMVRQRYADRVSMVYVPGWSRVTTPRTATALQAIAMRPSPASADEMASLDADALRTQLHEPAHQRTEALAASVGWWTVTNDPRVVGEAGYPLAAMAYQQAAAVFGPWIAGTILDLPAARDLAYQGARAVVEYGYTQDESGRWIEWDYVGANADGTPLPLTQYVEGRGAHRTGWFALDWFPFAPFVVLSRDPTNARARGIWDQIQRDAAGMAVPEEWIPPLGARR